jgi:hypothetical protein
MRSIKLRPQVVRAHLLLLSARSPQQSSQPSQGSGSRAGSALTVLIPPEGSILDIGSTISSLTRSSFHSVERTSSYLSPLYVTGSRPRSVDDSGFMSPEQARLAITPSRTSSLRRTGSMTDMDEYASSWASFPAVSDICDELNMISKMVA